MKLDTHANHCAEDSVERPEKGDAWATNDPWRLCAHLPTPWPMANMPNGVNRAAPAVRTLCVPLPCKMEPIARYGVARRLAGDEWVDRPRSSSYGSKRVEEGTGNVVFVDQRGLAYRGSLAWFRRARVHRACKDSRRRRV